MRFKKLISGVIAVAMAATMLPAGAVSVSAASWEDTLVAHYDFASGLPTGSEPIADNGSNATVTVSAPVLTVDSARGQVLSIQTGIGANGTDVANKSASYLRMTNPYSGMTLTGATISYWVKSSEDYGVMAGFDLDWGFAIADATPYVMYNTESGYFDGHATSAIPSGEWAMVTVTVASSGVTVYVNGQAVGYSQSGSATMANVFDTLSNAYYATAGFVYSPYLSSRGGLYDDFYYFSSALSASDVAQMYADTKATVQEPVSGDGDYTTGLLAHYDFASGLPSGSEAVAYNGDNITNTVSAPSLTIDSTRGQVLSVETGEGAGGTDVANKSASYLQMTNPYSGLSLTGATVSFWVNSTEDYGTMAGFDYDWGLAIADATPYVMYNTAAGYFDGHATASIPSGEWAMVTATIDSSNGITLYINGTKIAYSQSGGGTIANVLDTLSNAYWATVGFVYSPYLGSRGGLYDDLYYYNRALTAADVVALYNATKATAQEPVSGDSDYTTGLLAHYDFASGLPSGSEAVAYNGDNITNTVGAPSLTTDAVRGQVLSVEAGEGAGGTDVANKSASYLQMTNPYSGLSLTGATVSFWVNSTEDYGTMVGFDYDWGLAIADATPYVMYNTAAGYFDGHATASIPSGEWAMVTMTMDSSNGIALYINGTKIAYSQSGGGTIANVLDTLSNAYWATVGFVYSPYLGSRGGLYDDIYYYNRALTAADVLALYNATSETASANDKATLSTALQTANAIDQTLYTADSLVALNAAILVGQTTYDDEDATEKDIANAISAINSAISALVLIADSNVPSDGLLAHYDFANGLPSGSNAVAYNGDNITDTVSAPVLTTDSSRGQVLSIETGVGAGGTDVDNKSASYLQMTNPYSGLSLTGATVSFWVNSDEDYGVMAGFDYDWGLAIADETPYVMYNTAAGYFDGHATTAIPSGEWAMVTMTMDATDGVTLYVNGEEIAYSQSGTGTMANVFDTLSNAYWATVGFVYSPYLGSRGGLYDDIYYYGKALDSAEVLSLYNATKAGAVAPVNKTALGEALAAANAIDQTLYTADSLVALNAAILVGQTTYDADDATQDDVDNATAGINNAIGNLEEIVAVDKTALATALQTANAIDQTLYTDDSLVALNAAIILAQATYDAQDATQNDVDNAVAAINGAIAGLVAAVVDKTELEALIATANGYTLSGYTTQTADALTSAITAAQAVANNSSATQAQVDAAKTALQSAIDGLKALPGTLKINGANLKLENDLTITFAAKKSLFADGAYTNGYAVCTSGGVETTISIDEFIDYPAAATTHYGINFNNVSPKRINDTVTVVLYGTYDGVEYASAPFEYSAATYAYNMLGKTTDSKLRTLLVDMLNYGSASQIYTSYNTDSLANANLTPEQVAYGTADAPELTTVKNSKYAVIDSPSVSWKAASLELSNSVVMQFILSADDISNINIKITNASGTVLEEFTGDDLVPYPGYANFYTLSYKGLKATEMSKDVYATVYRNGVAVSNTFSYSIESYAYSNQNASNTALADLVVAMMKYGNSAYAYVN